MRRFSGHRSFSPPLRSVVLSRCPEKKYSDQLFSFYFLGLTSLTNAHLYAIFTAYPLDNTPFILYNVIQRAGVAE